MNSMNPELIRKFFDGKCSPEEVHQVLIWINSEKSAKELEEEFDQFEAPDNGDAIKSLAMLAKIHDRITHLVNESSVEPIDNVRRLQDKSKAKSKLFKKWQLGIAVSVLLTMMASTVWWFSIRREENHLVAEKPTPIEYVTKETLAGEKLTLKLSDGSIIQMNSLSKIRFPKSFSGESREVYMQGQIFFEVQRDESRPFIVHSKDLVTRVLGTSFAILEDSATQQSQVAVLTGKVKVSTSIKASYEESGELLLDPMDAASFDGLKGSFDKIKIDYDNAFAWKDKVIVFRNSSFEEVLKKLESWYGVSVQLNNDIKDRKDYSGRFDDQTLEEVLIGLSFTYDFEFEIKKSIIIIY